MTMPKPARIACILALTAAAILMGAEVIGTKPNRRNPFDSLRGGPIRSDN